MRNLTIFIFVVLCVSCGSPVNDSRLVTIDSLLQQGYPDSAMHSLEQINPAAYKIIDLHGEEELQVDKYVRDMLPKAESELDFNPIGI